MFDDSSVAQEWDRGDPSAQNLKKSEIRSHLMVFSLLIQVKVGSRGLEENEHQDVEQSENRNQLIPFPFTFCPSRLWPASV